MNEYLLLGVSLGLAAGLSPGPLLTYTVIATLRGGWKAGIGVGSAPLLTDAPIIALSLIVLHFLPPATLRLLNVVGGGFLLYLALETVRATRHVEALTLNTDINLSQEVWRGGLVNFLNPNPYLFWGTVGGPLLIQAYRARMLDAVLFLSVFYALLVGSHVGLAFLVHRQRARLRGPWYRRILWGLGSILGFLAARLIYTGFVG